VQYVVMNPDPGWNLTPRSLLGTLSPFRSLRRTDSDDTELAVLRRLFVSFCLALALVAVVVIVLRDGGDEDAPVGLSVATVVAVGIASLISGRSIGRRLDGSSDAALVASYRSRFFLRLAFAESAALAAFVIAISIGPWWGVLRRIGVHRRWLRSARSHRAQPRTRRQRPPRTRLPPIDRSVAELGLDADGALIQTSHGRSGSLDLRAACIRRCRPGRPRLCRARCRVAGGAPGAFGTVGVWL
jgi:F0F1-type ATP synthase membrane subunit c/vacuolar-type H+-ATPase subunit K